MRLEKRPQGQAGGFPMPRRFWRFIATDGVVLWRVVSVLGKRPLAPSIMTTDLIGTSVRRCSRYLLRPRVLVKGAPFGADRHRAVAGVQGGRLEPKIGSRRPDYSGVPFVRGRAGLAFYPKESVFYLRFMLRSAGGAMRRLGLRPMHPCRC